MCDEEKLLVFGDIKSQITRQSIFAKFSFYVKVSVYSLILLFLFSWIFFDFKDKVSNNVEIENKADVVQADFIGKVLQSNWTFEIYDNNKKLNTKLIRKWNTVVLKDNSYVKLAINEWIKMYLLGPAKINVDMEKDSKWKDVYILNVIDGDYLTVKSNSDKDKIVVKSKYLNIESNDKNIDIKYEEKKWVSIVENNGGSIIVKNKDKVISLEKQEKLIVLNDADKKYIENLFSDDYTKYQINNDWKIKRILSSKDMKRFGIMLDRQNLILAVWQYVLWKINDNKKLEELWRKQMINIIVNAYHILGEKIPYNDIDNLSDKELRELVANLIEILNKEYIIPNMYIQRLKVMLSYIIITEKVDIPEWMRFSKLSQFVNYLKIDQKYKDILLKF